MYTSARERQGCRSTHGQGQLQTHKLPYLADGHGVPCQQGEGMCSPARQ
jgi:hypothetical protein